MTDRVTVEEVVSIQASWEMRLFVDLKYNVQTFVASARLKFFPTSHRVYNNSHSTDRRFESFGSCKIKLMVLANAAVSTILNE